MGKSIKLSLLASLFLHLGGLCFILYFNLDISELKTLSTGNHLPKRSEHHEVQIQSPGRTRDRVQRNVAGRNAEP